MKALLLILLLETLGTTCKPTVQTISLKSLGYDEFGHLELYM